MNFDFAKMLHDCLTTQYKKGSGPATRYCHCWPRYPIFRVWEKI